MKGEGFMDHDESMTCSDMFARRVGVTLDRVSVTFSRLDW